MSSSAARFLFFVSLLFATYLWWIVNWSFYDSPAQQEVYISKSCGFFAGDVSDQVAGCCNDREKAYFDGGTYDLKLDVDAAFKQCVNQAPDNLTFLSRATFFLRPHFGFPFVHTPWRWGNGWPFGRGYR